MSDTRISRKPVEHRFRAPDSVELAGHAWGDAGHPPVILLHGGGQTRHAWKHTARLVAEAGFYAIAVDLRGHGDSDWSPDGDYSMDLFVSDLRVVAAGLHQPPIVIGASLGGVTALLAEGEGPSFLAALVLVDVTPSVQMTGVEKIRQFMGARVAEGFASVEAAAAAIAAYLPQRRRPLSLAGLGKNLRLHHDGRYRWHWDPALMAFSDRHINAGLSERLASAAKNLNLPVLLVRGAASELVSEADARAFLELVPSAAYADVAGAGHMVAGDLNDPFAHAVIDFLATLPCGRPPKVG